MGKGVQQTLAYKRSERGLEQIHHDQNHQRP